jgi:hypothetical protein
LPEKEQDEIAQALNDIIWKQLFARPESEASFEQMHADIERDIAEGKVYDISILDDLV